MTSIRRYLIVVLLGAMLLINLIAVAIGYRSSMAEAEKLFDEQLKSVASILSETPPGYYRTVANNNEIAYQIWQSNDLIASSDNAPSAPFRELRSGFTDVTIEGEDWRTFAGYVNKQKRWVIVAQSSKLRLTLANEIILDSVLPFVFSLPILGLLIWVVVGRGLKPLNVLAHEMQFKRSDDLRQLRQLEQPQELTSLVDSINALLRRLDAAFDRERQFAADAAHELRTPISVLKIQLHNLLADADQSSPALESLETAVERMSRSIEQVLTLYRVSPEQFVANFGPVDLAGLARNVIAELYPQLEKRQQSIELDGASVAVNGDASMLESLLLNLVENASRYGGTGGSIRVVVQEQKNGAVLIVEDSGPGIPVAQRERIFERFYRGERESNTTGTGIGLAIVKKIADIHHAQITVGESTFESGLAISINFGVVE